MTDMTQPTRSGLTCEDVRELAAPFVLGALETAEADAVRAHLATCADTHPELLELAGALEVLAESTPVVEPPASLGPRIRAAAAADLAARTHAERSAPEGRSETTTPALAPVRDAIVAPPAPAAPLSLDAERARRGRTGVGTWALRIAAVLVIAGLGGWNLLLQGQLSEAQRYERDVAAVLDVAAEPGSLTAVLTAEGRDGPSGLAAVGADGSVTLAMRDLAPTTGTEVYETWVIASDGVPQPLGSFTVGAGGVASFTAKGLPAEPGIVLALTREPGPGATAPTTDPVSVGTATAG